MTELSYSEIEKGVNIVIGGKPFKILETSPMFKARGHSVIQAKAKNLKTGEIISKTFHPSESFEEAEIDKKNLKFIYSHRGNYVFCERGNPSQRISFTEDQIGNSKNFLKEGQEVEGLMFKDKIISIQLPIKITLKVEYAPPGIKGNTSEGGTKNVTLETGSRLSVPLFINQGDVIEVNTEEKNYVRRIKKGKGF